MAAPSPPELIDDAIAEILLRLPSDEPECLVRASLVCKLWRRILSESTFPDRYREFHRTPPILGFLRGFYYSSKRSRFVPVTTRIPFLEPGFRCRYLDCRHGRILFHGKVGRWGPWGRNLVVWDPITGDHKVLSDPQPDSCCHSGVVLCAVAGCNHRGCHGGPFSVVVFVSSSSYNYGTIAARAWLYSSETAAWSTPAAAHLPEHSLLYARKRGALVGDQIYLLTGTGILKYDLGKHCLTMISLPCIIDDIRCPVLMTTEDGSLGLANVKGSTLHLWARKVNVDVDGSMGWVQDRVVSLNNLHPIMRTQNTCGLVNVIGFAEGVDILLLGEDASGYMFELKSGRFNKLSNPEYHYYDVIPYLSFYIPDFGTNKSPMPLETKQ